MQPEPTGEHVVVETLTGPVRGFWRRGSAAFLGIPFAEPPFGERRFRAPVPREPWTEVRDALEYAPTPQRKALAEITAIPEPSIPGEDILSVNVFTARPEEGAALPVLVYLHGGGFIAGSPASPWYDGAAFNRDGIVTVTVSYRLGFEGFGWLPDAPANRGVLDWIAALEWVRDNIARFGGDPARVTIAGQSAGGGAVMTLLTLPAARGLFSAVAAISPAPADIPLERAQETTARLAEALGVTPDAAGFGSVPELDLIRAQGGGDPGLTEPTADDLVAVLRGLGGLIGFGPVVDGELVVQPTTEALLAGVGADVPLLLGATADEFSGLVLANRALFEQREVEPLLEQVGLEPEVARRFARELPARHPAAVLGRYGTDLVFRRHVAVWADARRGPAPTWLYDFRWASAVSGIAEHCLDVPFVFDLLEDPAVARLAGPDAPQELADLVHGSYARFIAEHDPGWAAYADGARAQVFDVPPSLAEGAYNSAKALAPL
jgi:para-nitrobenzyl esterase